MDFITFFQEESSRSSPLEPGLSCDIPAVPSALGHVVALSCCRWGSEPQASPEPPRAEVTRWNFTQHLKHPLKGDGFTKACSPAIHNNAHQHQTNKSCRETGAFCQHLHQGQVGITCLWNGWAWSSRIRQQRIPFSRFLPLLLEQWSPRDWDPRLHLTAASPSFRLLFYWP